MVQAHGTVREIETSARSRPDRAGESGFLLETKVQRWSAHRVGGRWMMHLRRALVLRCWSSEMIASLSSTPPHPPISTSSPLDSAYG